MRLLVKALLYPRGRKGLAQREQTFGLLWPISFADRALTCALRKCAKQSSISEADRPRLRFVIASQSRALLLVKAAEALLLVKVAPSGPSLWGKAELLRKPLHRAFTKSKAFLKGPRAPAAG